MCFCARLFADEVRDHPIAAPDFVIGSRLGTTTVGLRYPWPSLGDQSVMHSMFWRSIAEAISFHSRSLHVRHLPPLPVIVSLSDHLR